MKMNIQPAHHRLSPATGRWLGLAMAALLFACGLAMAQNVGETLMSLLEADAAGEHSSLPEGTAVEQQYRNGPGEPVGVVDFVDNEAYILHSTEPKVAFRAFKNNPVFQGDTLYTMAKSGLVVILNDQSRFTMAANARLVIDKSLYDAERSTRDTVLELTAGKARFVARKINPYGAEDFKVRTTLATCGIRGSDFAMALTPRSRFGGKNPKAEWRLPEWLVGTAHAQGGGPDMLVVLTGENTTVSVTGQAGPPVVLGSFSVTGVFQGQAPLPPQPAPPEAAGKALDNIGGNVAVMKVPRIFE